MELLAIADRRVAELNEEIRMLEKQVTKTPHLGNVSLLKLEDVDLCQFHPSTFPKKKTQWAQSTLLSCRCSFSDETQAFLPH